MHGDSLCTDDVSYQRYRRWTRSRILQWCFLHLSKSYRQKISDKIKQKSREQKQHKSAMIMDVNQNEVISTMSKFNVTQLIHGHTHRPAFHQFKINQQTANRIVLGDWDNHVSFLKYDNHKLELIDHRIPDQANRL
jgi:UDP-2,3-diacylglucosamine hydrolase